MDRVVRSGRPRQDNPLAARAQSIVFLLDEAWGRGAGWCGRRSIGGSGDSRGLSRGATGGVVVTSGSLVTGGVIVASSIAAIGGVVIDRVANIDRVDKVGNLAVVVGLAVTGGIGVHDD